MDYLKHAPSAPAGVLEVKRFHVDGVVEHGDKRGRLLGFPTANIKIPEQTIEDGVWAGTVQVPRHRGSPLRIAAVSVGRRPTYYQDGVRLLEAHLIDFNGDLYGQDVLVTLVKYLRPQKAFSDPRSLILQLHGDVADVRSWGEETGLWPAGNRRSSADVSGSSGRRYAVGGKRRAHDAGEREKMREKRALKRDQILGQAARDLVRKQKLTHEALEVETGVPVGYLMWKYPTKDALHALADPVPR